MGTIDLGVSSPAKPARTVAYPGSSTRAATSSVYCHNQYVPVSRVFWCFDLPPPYSGCGWVYWLGTAMVRVSGRQWDVKEFGDVRDEVSIAVMEG